MKRPTDDRIARMIQLDPSETGSGFDAPTVDLPEDWHEPHQENRTTAPIGSWIVWGFLIAVAVFLVVALWRAWGAQ